MTDEFEPQLVVKKEPKVKPITGPGIFWLLIVVSLMLMAGAVVIFGQAENDISQGTISPTESPADSKQTRIYTVSYKSGVFSPTNLRIHSGDTVRFKNDGLFSIHIIADPPEDLVGFDSVGDVPPGSYFTYTFAAKGTFGYRNERDRTETGAIIVR